MSKKIKGKIMVLHEDIDHDYFVRVLEEENFTRIKEVQGDGKFKPYYDAWMTPDKKNSIYFIKDVITGGPYLWIEGNYNYNLMCNLCGWFPFYQEDSMIREAVEAEEHDEAVNAILRVGLGFIDYDPRAVKLFEAYLTAPSPLLRKATVQALAYRMWDENIKLLEKTAREDSDESVKQFAQRALDEFKQQLQTN